jgi:hypothetical protein
LPPNFEGIIMANGIPRVKKSNKSVYRMKRVVHEMEDNFYGKVCPSRKQEVMDSRMVQEDHNAFANLSPNFINRQFKANRFMQSLGKFDEKDEIGCCDEKKVSY